MSARSLAEPQVLAHAKTALFPAADDAYAVTDTQFATDTWLADTPVPESVRERLAPFNHVRVGSGYPDLLGVTHPGEGFVAEAEGAVDPLVVVEAKGYTGGSVDVERGIVQADDRLSGANLAYVAAPADAIATGARTLARNLNVGVLGVHDGGHVEVVEQPRVVGASGTRATDAIRFQATAQGVADRSFSLNHPKNYLAYPLAVHCDGPTGDLVAEHVVRAVDAAREGAAFLGLVETAPAAGEERLTALGSEVVRFGAREYGDTKSALRAFEKWKRSRKRFLDVAPRWGQVARQVVFEYPATGLLVETLQALHDDGVATPTLYDLAVRCYERDPTFAVELFVSNRDDARARVFDDDGNIVRRALGDGTVYQSATTFQLKAMLYHAGIVTERGAEPVNVDPTEDVWALRTPI